jgi:hypothetical protein
MDLDTSHLVALAAALGWASGLRLYAVVFLTGAAGFMGWVPLPAGLQVLQQPVVLGVSFLLFVVEFIADKIPGVDTLWDALHTFIRIPAGAALAATSHAAKATTRAAANTSPEPFSNVALSLAGDLAVPGMLWLAFNHPLVFWPVLAVAVVCALVLIVVLFKFLRALLRRFSPKPQAAA